MWRAVRTSCSWGVSTLFSPLGAIKTWVGGKFRGPVAGSTTRCRLSIRDWVGGHEGCSMQYYPEHLDPNARWGPIQPPSLASCSGGSRPLRLHRGERAHGVYARGRRRCVGTTCAASKRRDCLYDAWVRAIATVLRLRSTSSREGTECPTRYAQWPPVTAG